MAKNRARFLQKFWTQLEELEPRRLLAGYDPTAAAQALLLELNQARANPAAYGAAIGVDLSGMAPAPPLAFDPRLVQAAVLHSQDMNGQGYFSHVTPQGVDAGGRLTAALYPWTSYGESIAGGPGLTTPAAALSDLIIDGGVPDLSHRQQLLGMATYAAQNQVGIGIVLGAGGPLTNYFTIDTASSSDSRPDLTGVVYIDGNGNGQYDAGEGVAGATISVAGVGSVTTFASGGYTVPLSPGTYAVTVSGGSLEPMTQTVTIGASNVQVNFVEPPPSPVFFTVTAANALERHDGSGWSIIGAAGTIGSLSSVVDASGTPVVYAVTTNHALFRYSDRSGWAQIGGAGTIQTVSAGTDFSGAADVFAITTWGAFYEFSAGGGWQCLAGGGVQSVAAVGHGDAYVLKPDGSVSGYSPTWGLYPLTSSGFAQSMSAVNESNGNEVVFAVTRDQGLYVHDTSGWIRLGAAGTIQSAAAGTDAAGHAAVFAITAGRALYEYDTATGWLAVGGPGALAAITPVPGGIIFAATADQSLFEHTDSYGWLRLSQAGFAHL
jgi:uncharacterized protein YkwD